MSDLTRFLDAQQNEYEIALAEIKNGKKKTHWMWYVFPQLEFLGVSSRSKFYGIKDRKEAIDYLQHEVLGKRLTEISSALLEIKSNDPKEVMGSPDDHKLRSSMTLFSELENINPVFKKVLDKYYSGKPDEKTIEFLTTHENRL